jgi:hypothetical protein
MFRIYYCPHAEQYVSNIPTPNKGSAGLLQEKLLSVAERWITAVTTPKTT